MLRRVRLGHLLPQGGEALMPHIRAYCQAELGWDDVRWEEEAAAYLDLWRQYYSLPEPSSVPDWRVMLDEARAKRQAAQPTRRRKVIKRSALAGVLAALALLLACVYWRRRKV
jgi:glycerol-3-phosphate dehydrogenase